MDREETLSLEELSRIVKETVEGIRELRARFEETDERFRETDRQFRETRREIDRIAKMVGDLTGKWGKFVEGLVAPGAVRLFKEWGIDVERTYQRVKARRDGREIEIDVMLMDEEYVVLIEVKTTLTVEDVREHIERIQSFREFFPEYADRKIVGAVAGITFDEDSDKFAYRQGLFVIGQSGETVKILNDPKFKPRIW